MSYQKKFGKDTICSWMMAEMYTFISKLNLMGTKLMALLCMESWKLFPSLHQASLVSLSSSASSHSLLCSAIIADTAICLI